MAAAMALDAQTAERGDLTGPKAAASITRREKLLNMKQREDVKDELVTKFRDKFGSSGKRRGADEVSLTSTTIRREVDKCMGATGPAPMTAKNLQRLERRLQSHAQGKSPAEIDAASVGSVSAYTTGSTVPNTGSRTSNRSGALTARAALQSSAPPNSNKHFNILNISADAAAAPPTPLSARQVGDAAYALKANPAGEKYDWSKLDQFASVLHERDAVLARKGQQELQHKFRLDLDRQIKDVESKKVREQEHEKVYVEMQNAEYVRSLEEDGEKAVLMRQKANEEKQDRDIQLVDIRKKRVKEEEQKRREGQELRQKLEVDWLVEKEKEEARFKLQREHTMHVVAEGRAEVAKRSEALQTVEADHTAALEEYQRQMEVREKQVKHKYMSKVENRQMMTGVVGCMISEEAAKTKEVETRSMQEKVAKDKADIENEKANRRKQRAQRMNAQEYVLGQIDVKKDLQRIEEENKSEQLEMANVDYAKAVEKDRNDVQRRRQRNVEHRQEIERQMQQKMDKPPPGKYEMSDVEVAMNKKLLKTVDDSLCSSS